MEISPKQILIDILIQITNALSQVTTMKLHSLSLDQTEHSEIEELLVFPSTISTSQIRKVYALMKHYSTMSYLKIDSFGDMKIVIFVRNILKKIKRESNQHFRFLCFRAPTTDNSMIKTSYRNFGPRIFRPKLFDLTLTFTISF